MKRPKVRRITQQGSAACGRAQAAQRVNALDTDGKLAPHNFIRDRDCCYGGSFNARAARLGIEAMLTPVQAPKANAVAERVVGTLRRECLDHVIVINERQSRRVLWEYAAHYNEGRPHRWLGLETPTGPRSRADPPPSGRVVARSVLGGLHHEYEWVAA
jgi:putative transposase